MSSTALVPTAATMVATWRSAGGTETATPLIPVSESDTQSSGEAHSLQLARVRIPPYHWWRTVFYLIPVITVYTIVLGTASILSSLFDRRGYFAHRCARGWSWLILKTTGVRVRVEGLDRVAPGANYIFVSNHQSIYDTPVI